jgi:cytochrome c-type biogenesis protein CcmF
MTLSTAGNLLLVLASIAAIASIVSIAASGKGSSGAGARKLGNVLTFAVLGFITLAVSMLAAAFLGDNYTLEYVLFNHSTDTSPLSWLYKLSGVWAGREGSLLFWEWMIAIFAGLLAYKFLKKDDRLGSVGLAVLNFVQIFFLAALFIDLNNPFVATPSMMLDPVTGAALTDAAMNPLLQNFWMVLHPPTLFIGYAGLAVPFAFAIAALITGDTSKRWIELADRITVFSWLLLGIGIGLGAIWAYVELAFGGFWAWDPVENASVLPWFTGVALIHSMTVYRRRGTFKAWTMMLTAVTFMFVLLGTFITRSGIVQSVHAFEEDPLSFWLFMTMMVGVLVSAAIGVSIRKKSLSSEADGFERVFSKEGSYYFNNVIMVIASVLIAYLTMASAFKEWPFAWLTSWWPGAGEKFLPARYDALARPIGIFYIMIMTVCPILSWGGGDWKKLVERAKWPLAGGTVLAAGLVALFFTSMLPYFSPAASESVGVHHFLALLGLVTAGYGIALPLWLFIDGTRRRAAAREESLPVAFVNLFSKARTQSGGYLTHLGMAIILVGLIGSTMFVSDFDGLVSQKAGELVSFEHRDGATGEVVTTTDAHGYTFAFKELETRQQNVGPDGTGDQVYVAHLDLAENGKPQGELTPKIVFPQQLRQKNGSTQKVSIVQQPLKDIFVSFHGVDAEDNLQLTIKFFPMQWWVWIGFILTIVGAGLASWPKSSKLAEA